MSIRTLVVDDEPLARSRMKRLLADHPDVELVGEGDSGAAAVSSVLQLRPDLVLLDVQMPGMTGIEALQGMHDALPESLWPLVVFTTAHEEHAVEAFALEGMDYILKPVEAGRLAQTLKRVRKLVYARQPAGPPIPQPAPPGAAPEPPPPAATPAPEPSGRAQHLAAHRAGKIIRLALADVACVAVEDTITFAYTPTGRYRLKLTLSQAEQRLNSPPFVRVSRSAILQLGWVEHLVPAESGTYTAVMRAPVEAKLAVSRRRARQLRELLGW